MLLTVIMAFAGAQTAGAEIIGDASGTCGDNLSWTLTENGEATVTWANGTTGHTALTLTITGSGNMADYTDDTQPWKSDRQSITRITLPDGLTSIGNYAFFTCNNVKSISIPALVTRIGQNALSMLGNRASSCTVKFAEGSQLTSIGANAFYSVNAALDMTNCTKLTAITKEDVFRFYKKTVIFPRSLTSVCANAFKKITGGGTPTIKMDYDGILIVNGTTVAEGTGTATITGYFNVTTSGSSAVTMYGGIGLTWNAEGKYYEINDEQDLIYLGDFTSFREENTCEGMTFKLTRDLDFTNMPTRSVNGNSGNFHPIGLVEDARFEGSFRGHFDGQGYTIKGLRYTNNLDISTNNAEAGLFKEVVGSSAVMERVVLIDPQMRSEISYCGGIAGMIYNGATIRNCTVLGGSMAGTYSRTGGIVGKHSGLAATIEGCTVIGTSVNVNDGLIIGLCESQQTIKDCIYYDPYGRGIASSNNGYTDGGGNQRVYQLTLGEGITGTGATYSTPLLPGKAYYASGATVTLGHGTRVGYVFGGYSASPAQTISNGTFTMPDEDVSVSATWTPDPDFSGNGDGTEYTINTAAGWDKFCDLLDNNDNGYFTGKTVKLGNSIGTAENPVTHMHSNYRQFTGTFDGKGHTLTVGYNSSYYDVAPFRKVGDGCVIENLIVEGTITAGQRYAAGIVGEQYGAVTIRNCRSSVTIQSTVSGDGTHGGLVGLINDGEGNSLTIEGCVFDGKIVSTGSTATTRCGGFVGYKSNNGSLTIKNSLCAPQADDNAVSDGATFARNWSMPANANCYYTATLGSAQGKQPHTVTAGANVSISNIALTGDATAYDVSGITAYSGGGIKYGDNLYYGKDDAVSLTLADDATDVPGPGYVNKDGYTVSAGTLSGSTLTMPDKDVVVTVRWAPDPQHFDKSADGSYTIKTATGWNVFCDALQDLNTYNRFSGKTVKLYGDIPTAEEKAAGTTAVTRMAGTSQHDFCGTFDGGGHTLTVNLSSTYGQDYTAPFSYVSTTKANPGDTSDSPAAIRNLNVTGTVTATKDYAGGIVGAFWGTLTIENCTSSVNINTGNKHAAGFIGHARGDVTLRNCLSSVTINSSTGGDGTHGGFIGVAVSGKTFTIEGCAFTGSLLSTGTGENATTHCGGFVGWNGGTLNIRNSLFAPASVSVGASNSATFSRYDDGSVTNIDNCYYTSELNDGEHYTGQGKQRRSIAAGEGINLGHDGAATEYSVSLITAYKATGASGDSDPFIDGILYDGVLYAGSGDAVSLTLANSGAGAPAGYQYSGGYTVSGGATLSGSTLTMADDNVTVSFTPGDLRSTHQAVPVSYIDENGILCDGQDGRPDPASAIALDGSESSLGQGGQETWYFVGADIERSDQITCFGNVHIILCDGKTMTVNNDGYGIYGNEANLTIYGQTLGSGTLNASGTIGDGISTNDVGCDVTITGGTVNATSTISDGICAMGSVTITGGQVTANSIYADVSITLGWTNASDFIKVSRYSVGPYDGCPKIAVGQTLYDEDGKLYYGDWECIPEGVTLSPNVLALDDAADNSAAITASNEKSHNVILQGRTLYKDGAWNTLCLPFAMNAKEIAATPLAGADIRALSTTIVHEGAATGFDPQTGTLTLNFTPAAPASGAVNAIEPGVPYIVKWPIPDGMTPDDFAAAYAANPDAYEIHDPVFSGITVRSTAPADHAVTSADGYVTFVGTYSPAAIYADPATALYLGAANKLYWPSSDGYTVNAFRAYFQLNNGLTCGTPIGPEDPYPGSTNVRAFNLSFGDGSESQGIKEIEDGRLKIENEAGAWYDLQGRRMESSIFNSQSSIKKKGLYINNGKKVVIK